MAHKHQGESLIERRRHDWQSAPFFFLYFSFFIFPSSPPSFLLRLEGFLPRSCQFVCTVAWIIQASDCSIQTHRGRLVVEGVFTTSFSSRVLPFFWRKVWKICFKLKPSALKQKQNRITHTAKMPNLPTCNCFVFYCRDCIFFAAKLENCSVYVKGLKQEVKALYCHHANVKWNCKIRWKFVLSISDRRFLLFFGGDLMSVFAANEASPLTWERRHWSWIQPSAPLQSVSAWLLMYFSTLKE